MWCIADEEKKGENFAAYIKHKYPDAVGMMWHPEVDAANAILAYEKQDANYESHWPFWVFGIESKAEAGEEAGEAEPNQD